MSNSELESKEYDDDLVIAPEDALRADPPFIEEGLESAAADAPPAARTPPTEEVKFRVEPTGEPQNERDEYFVIDQTSGNRFYVGFVHNYRTRRGIARYASEIVYDRFAEEPRIGLWAHFIWPSVMGEGGGKHLVVNSYDRAHFTWGFYQLAAHTADDNLILLMRQLLAIPAAKFYFPDLTLAGDKVAKITPNGPKSLETPVWSEPHREHQIPDFMKYMNPSTARAENAEVINAAKFVDWARRDPAMLETTVRVSFGIMKRKIKRFANRYGLVGRRPELAIWISDMHHQGRQSESEIRQALALPTFNQQLDALSVIDTTGQHGARLATVKGHVQTLINENRFRGVEFGRGPLALDGEA